MLPASTSDCCTVYVPTNSQVALGANVAHVAVAGVIRSSVTTTLFSVTLPVFVDTTVYVRTSPTLTVPLASPSALPVTLLLIVIAGD